MTKALITGITGFVGGHLERELVSNGYSVMGTGLSSPHLDYLANEIRMDVIDKEQVYNTIRSFAPDVIFHLAAIAYVPTSWEEPQRVIDVNTTGTINILEAVKDTGYDTIVHLAGSSEEYGLVHPNEVPISEDQPLRPLSPYAVSKIAMDMIGYQYYKSHNMKIIRTRAFNHDGFGRGPQYMTSTFAKQLVEIKLGLGDPILMHGNLEAQRDITDVRDIARAYRLATERAEFGEVYNIGSGVTHKVSTILDKLISLSDVKSHIEGELYIKSDPQRMRPSDVPILQCDSSKFREDTDWEPEYTIDDTLKEVLRYWEERLNNEVN